MNEFSIRLDTIRHGWVTLIFSDSETSLIFDASYIPFDTLSELLNGANRLLDGRSSEIKMNLEPEEEVISLIPLDDSNLIATIAGHEFLCSRIRFARQILKMFDSYSYVHGKDKYEKNWGYPFPVDLVARIRQMIEA